jgi:hypothetical protein
MKRTAVRCFVLVTVLFMTSIILRFFVLQVLIQKMRMDNVITRMVFFDELLNELLETDTGRINWAALYPFRENDTGNNKGRIENLGDRAAGVRRRIEKYTKDLLINHMNFIEWAVQYEKIAGWNVLNEDIFDMGDGHLSEVIKKSRCLPSRAAAIYDFYDFLQSMDIDFLYVQSPYKIQKNDTITGTLDFSGQNSDELLYALSSRQIPCIDLRDNIQEENLDHRSLFYRTDHHWKTETGLWAAKKIAEYLNEHKDMTIDLALFDPERYHHDIFKDWHLGILGKKVTLVRTRADDFTFIHPGFDTDFSLKIPDKHVDTRGNFDVFMEHAMLDKKNYYLLDAYGAYLYGNRPLINIHNNGLSKGKRVLLIKDSFVNVVAPFLSMGIEILDMVDARIFDGSIKNYIEKTKPDMVIILYNQASIKSDALFDLR